MIRLRIADQPDPAAIAAARADLARLTGPTYLGWSRRTAIGVGVALAVIGGAIGLVLPTPDVCAIVEHGPTGPEPDVTLGRTVEVCRDGSAIVTTWIVTTGEVVEVVGGRR
jgi:hypothetical protein